MDELDHHRSDRYAHNESWEEQRKPYIDKVDNELFKMYGGLDRRLTIIEKFKEQVKGGLVVVAALLGGGLATIILHLLKIV